MDAGNHRRVDGRHLLRVCHRVQCTPVEAERHVFGGGFFLEQFLGCTCQGSFSAEPERRKGAAQRYGIEAVSLSGWSAAHRDYRRAGRSTPRKGSAAGTPPFAEGARRAPGASPDWSQLVATPPMDRAEEVE